MGHDYRQNVMTPREIWVPLLQTLGRERFSLELFNDRQTAGNVPADEHLIWPIRDALREPWQRRAPGRWSVFGNPEFNNLDAVLQKAASMRWDSETNAELTLLVPLRPHRTFWDFAHTSDLEVHLPAFPFEGETSSFPLPCCILHWGPNAKQVALEMARQRIGKRSWAVVRRHPLTRFPAGHRMASVLSESSITTLEAAIRLVAQAHPMPASAGLSISDVLRSDLNAAKALSRQVLNKVSFDQASTFAPKGDASERTKMLAECLSSIPEAIAFVLLNFDASLIGSHGWLHTDTLADVVARWGPRGLVDEISGGRSEGKRKKANATENATAKENVSSDDDSGPRKPPKTARARKVKDTPSDADETDPQAVEEAVTAFIFSKNVGEAWSISELLAVTPGSKSKVLRTLKNRTDVETFGVGRGAKWRRVQ